MSWIVDFFLISNEEGQWEYIPYSYYINHETYYIKKISGEDYVSKERLEKLGKNSYFDDMGVEYSLDLVELRADGMRYYNLAEIF